MGERRNTVFPHNPVEAEELVKAANPRSLKRLLLLAASVRYVGDTATAPLMDSLKSRERPGGETFVAVVMQAAGLRDGDHLSDPAWHDRARLLRASPLVIVDVRRQDAAQVALGADKEKGEPHLGASGTHVEPGACRFWSKAWGTRNMLVEASA